MSKKITRKKFFKESTKYVAGMSAGTYTVQWGWYQRCRAAGCQQGVSVSVKCRTGFPNYIETGQPVIYPNPQDDVTAVKARVSRLAK